MKNECPSSNLQMIPIDKIEVLNSRDRNGKVFADIPLRQTSCRL